MELPRVRSVKLVFVFYWMTQVFTAQGLCHKSFSFSLVPSYSDNYSMFVIPIITCKLYKCGISTLYCNFYGCHFIFQTNNFNNCNLENESNHTIYSIELLIQFNVAFSIELNNWVAEVVLLALGYRGCWYSKTKSIWFEENCGCIWEYKLINIRQVSKLWPMRWDKFVVW